MKFKMTHQNFNVKNIEKSMEFYEKALGLKETRRFKTDAFTIVYLGNAETDFQLELTQLNDHPQKYDLGECEFHLAFHTDNIDEARRLHTEMNCICYENPAMGIYFIEDPDGYWLEILGR